MDKVLGAAGTLLGWRREDVWADRLSSRYTVFLFVMLAFVSGLLYSSTAPLICFLPNHFSDIQVKFAMSYCWVNDTYYYPEYADLPMQKEIGKRYLSYYQWVPLLLAVQSALFFLPSLLWRRLSSRGVLDVSYIISSSKLLAKQSNREELESIQKFLSHQILGFISYNRMQRRKCSCQCERSNCYLVIAFFSTKLLYLMNIILQFVVFRYFITYDYYTFAIKLFRLTDASSSWVTNPSPISVPFPRVTLCDLSIRRLGNLHRYTIQCTLPINMYNEKIFQFLWWWIIMVAVVSVVSLLLWFSRILLRRSRLNFVKRRLRAGLQVNGEQVDAIQLKDFCDHFLQPDGVLLFHFIDQLAGHLIASATLAGVWEQWKSLKVE